jgi:putative ABC transport system permease protein
MAWLGEQWRTLSMRLRRNRHDQELADEMAHHLELRAERLRESGLSADEARRVANRRFGNVLLERERSRDVWGWPRLETYLQDIRYAVRLSWKRPAFAVLVVLTMALGIGANTAVFALLHGLLLRPASVADPDRLVVLFSGREGGTPYRRLSYPNYLDIRERARTLASLATFCWPVPVDLSSDGSAPAERVWAQLVSGNFFDVLGLPASIGRTFASDEDLARNTHLVSVVSHGFWQSRLGADPSIVGKTIRLNGRPFTVIGVAPSETPQVDPPFEPDLWAPMAVQAVVMPGQDGKLDSRSETWLRGIGRLRPAASLAQAQAELATMAASLAKMYPNENRRLTLTLRTQGDARAIVMGMFGATGLTWVLFGLVALLLLIACANLAGLLSVRALSRTREITVRVALGAGRARLFRQLFTESSLLVLTGGAAGIVVAWMGSRHLWTLVLPPVPFPVRIDAATDGPVLLFAVTSTCLTALVFGLLPALHATRLDIAGSLKGAGVAAETRGQRRVHGFLVAAQVCLSVVVLVAATLFVRSLREASRIDVGFATANRTIATVQLGRQGYEQYQVSKFYEEVLGRLRELPAVRSVTTTAFLPLSGGYLGDRVIYREGEFDATDETRPVVILDRVGPDYFRTVGTSLLRGRDVTDADQLGSPPVAVINETFAATFWPGADPIGKRFRIGGIDKPLVEVVGLVADGRYQSIQEPPERRMFLPVRQDPQLEITWIVHANTPPSEILGAIRREVSAMDSGIPVVNATTLQSHVDRTLVQSRVFALLATLFGVIALLLAAVGIYGMLSLMIRSRTREIGIRVALGARPGQVLRMIVRPSVILAAMGLGTGALVGGWTSRALAPMLYGRTAFDASILLVVAAALASMVLIGTILPARRAVRVDPARVLRQE